MISAGQTVCSQRTVIIGNTGSGKSTVAKRLAARRHVRAIDLDSLHWEDESYDRKRDEAEASRLVVEVAAKPRWIIEGVYGWLASVAIPRATALVWLDLPWTECRAAILARGPRRGADQTAFDALLSWGEGYATRTTSSSCDGHWRIFEDFAQAKLRLRSRDEVDEYLAKVAV
jgi:adenylate kinase family enzyme